MSRIEAIKARGKYVSEDHLMIAVDGVPLDTLLDTLLPGHTFTGLVSSLLGWFHNEEDSVVPWQRILPEAGCSSWAPLFICPDDLDYSCIVVMVEVAAERDLIRWERFGLDETRKGPVGSCVRWLSGAASFRFDRAEYERCLAVFRAYNPDL